MTTFPGSPRLLKVVLVGVDKFNPLASVILFQYNRTRLRARCRRRRWWREWRSLHSEALHPKGAPVETVTGNGMTGSTPTQRIGNLDWLGYEEID
jgi:hypothetical protein